MTLPGIDLAHWQDPTPSLAGLSFAFAKATEGTGYVDPMYATHIANINAAGIVDGAYHFSRDDSGTPAAQAAFFVTTAGDRDLYALDVEGTHAFSPSQVTAFMDAMHALGKRCGLYMSRSPFGAYLDCHQDWNWVADYVTGWTPDIPWAFWQYGPRQIGGTAVDGDVFNGDMAALLKLTGKGSMYTFNLVPGATTGTITVKADAPHLYLRLLDDTFHTARTTWAPKQAYGPVTLVPPIPGGVAGADRATGVIIGDEAAFMLASDVIFTPTPALTQAQIDAAVAAQKAADAAACQASTAAAVAASAAQAVADFKAKVQAL